jgi:hypothetical protein
MDRGFSNPHLYDLLDVGRRFGQLTRLGRLRDDRNWPEADVPVVVKSPLSGKADIAV